VSARIISFPGTVRVQQISAKEHVAYRIRAMGLDSMRTYMLILLGWEDGRTWFGVAAEGAAGCYAGVQLQRAGEGDFGSAWFVPNEQPRNAAEAIDALRTATAREVASSGEPDAFSRLLYAVDGDKTKMDRLLDDFNKAWSRFLKARLFLEQIRVFWLVKPLWEQLRWRLMRREWRA
jgi:hypothetical protein